MKATDGAQEVSTLEGPDVPVTSSFPPHSFIHSFNKLVSPLQGTTWVHISLEVNLVGFSRAESPRISVQGIILGLAANLL